MRSFKAHSVENHALFNSNLISISIKETPMHDMDIDIDANQYNDIQLPTYNNTQGFVVSSKDKSFIRSLFIYINSFNFHSIIILINDYILLIMSNKQ